MSAPIGVVLARSFTDAPLEESMTDSAELTAGQKRFVFILLVLELFTGQLDYGLFSPFFPKEADHKGVSSSTQGLIFGSFQLVVLLFTPAAMKLVPIVGQRNLLNTANFIIGGANLLFAFVWFLPAGMPFTIACFACRIVAGIGVSIAMTVGYGMLPYLFGDKLSTGSSILETAIGLAFIVAPVLGGFLFTAAGGESGDGLGFVVPFVVIGGAQLLLGIYSLAFFPVIPMPSSSSDSRINFFSPRVILPCILCAIAAGAIEYMSPTLEPMLEDDPYFMSVAGTSTVFAGCSVVYVVTGPLIGIIDDRTEGRFALPIMGVGMLGLAAGYILLGPAFFALDWGLQPSAVSLWAGISVIGISTAFALIPTYNNMYKWARHVEEDDKANATSVLYNLFYAAGAWLGPTIGGLKVGGGIPESYTILGVFSFAIGIMVLVFFMLVRHSEIEVRDVLMTEALAVPAGKAKASPSVSEMNGNEKNTEDVEVNVSRSMP